MIMLQTFTGSPYSGLKNPLWLGGHAEPDVSDPYDCVRQ